MSQEYITFTIGQKKNIALIAHDNEKPKLIAWCKEHKAELEKHNLYGTGTTARMITDQTGLTVKGYNSGPLGGDQQIGAKIVEGVIDFVIFFSDPLTAQPHDPDVKALMRISQVYDIPMAVNKSTADFMITSCYMNRDYQQRINQFQTAYCNVGQKRCRCLPEARNKTGPSRRSYIFSAHSNLNVFLCLEYAAAWPYIYI